MFADEPVDGRAREHRSRMIPAVGPRINPCANEAQEWVMKHDCQPAPRCFMPCRLLRVMIFCACVSAAAGHGGYLEERQRVDQQLALDPANGGLWYHRACLDFHHGEWQQVL